MAVTLDGAKVTFSEGDLIGWINGALGTQFDAASTAVSNLTFGVNEFGRDTFTVDLGPEPAPAP